MEAHYDDSTTLFFQVCYDSSDGCCIACPEAVVFVSEGAESYLAAEESACVEFLMGILSLRVPGSGIADSGFFQVLLCLGHGLFVEIVDMVVCKAYVIKAGINQKLGVSRRHHEHEGHGAFRVLARGSAYSNRALEVSAGDGCRAEYVFNIVKKILSVVGGQPVVRKCIAKHYVADNRYRESISSFCFLRGSRNLALLAASGAI